MDCPMCGSPLGGDDAPVCGTCPLALPSGCRSELVRCPTCGYHTLASPTGAGTVDPGWAADPTAPTPLEGPGGPVRALSDVRRGESGRIVGFGELDAAALRDLMAHGVVASATVRLLQRRPAYVLELSGGDVAVGDELADSILVAVAS